MADTSIAVRLAAARGLRDLGPLGPAVSARVHEAFVAFTTSPLTELRMLGVEGLVNTGAAATLVLPAARSALADSQAPVRLSGVVALGRLGPPASVAIPDLERTLRDVNAIVRSASASAIGQIAPQQATLALRRALRDPEEGVRREAAHALEGFHRRGGQDDAPPEPSRRP
ncbi:MAG: HEAT repeat domain-containing protein [Gemmatimonadaceae bacterium]